MNRLLVLVVLLVAQASADPKSTLTDLVNLHRVAAGVPVVKSVTAKRAPSTALRYRGPVREAVQHWMADPSARARLLDPRLEVLAMCTVGGAVVAAFPQTRSQALPKQTRLVVYPAPHQRDVPVAAPITLSLYSMKRLPKASRVKTTIHAAGTEIAHRRKLLKGPAGTHSTIALEPRGALKRSTVYKVRVVASIGKFKVNEQWLFATSGDPEERRLALAKAALARVNYHRRIAGVGPVTLNPKLSMSCMFHCEYLAHNDKGSAIFDDPNVSMHDEDSKLPKFSRAGQEAGQASNIERHTRRDAPFDSVTPVDGLIHTLYHRVPLLDPRLATIGFAYTGNTRYWYSAIRIDDTSRSPDGLPTVVAYPAPDQTGIPPAFERNEIPDPIPPNVGDVVGAPVTVTFYGRRVREGNKWTLRHPRIERVKATLRSDRSSVRVWLSWPGNPTNDDRPDNAHSICLFAHEALLPETWYTVSVHAVVAGTPWEKTWKFRTGQP